MGQVRLARIDHEGLALTHDAGEADLALDVLLDGRRVWSFWVLRDTRTEAGELVVEWPRALRRFLHGTTDVTVLEHVSTRVLHEGELRFGDSDERIAVVDGAGRPLAMDKSGRMAQTFDTRSAAHVGPLLDAVEQVLAALDEAGIDAFLAYGSLLGAVREGRLIGHDSDADLGYVSRHRHPVDVARESFELQRRLTAMGYPIHRYSGAAFRIDVREGDGSVRGLDLFGGFLDEGTLFLMGEVGHPFREEWVRPLGRATLEGRSFPVPAEPERLLEAMYGPAWRVPDPAYVFTTPVEVQRALNGWFRGVRVHRQEYGAWYAAHRHDPVDVGPSALAAHLLEQETRDEGVPPRVLDLGAGRATDSLWLARQGLSVTAYDYLPSAAEPAQERAAAEGLDLEVETVNLLDLRSTLSAGAREARRTGPTAVLARHVADCTTVFGRESLWRLARMALRARGHDGGSGGRLYVEHWVDGGEPEFIGQRRVPTERLVAELEARGARVVHVEERTEVGAGDGSSDQSRDSAGATGHPGRTIGRLVAQWQD
ncbi:hypothetical protein GCM10027596_23620 [Nocardioides korecus]